MKDVLVVGAGSVGGYFGAHLARKHSNVSFLLRPHTQMAVAQKGLRIRSAIGESFTVHPRSSSDPKDFPNPDLVILGVKAYDLPETLDQLAPIVSEHTTILTLQNGVTIEDRVKAVFGREHVVGGVAFIYSKISEPGVIEHFKKGMLSIGELMGLETPRLLQIKSLFKEAGIPCFLSKDIRKSKWEKMCWNCVFNPLTVVLNDRVARALDHEEIQPIISTIVREVSAVAMAAHRVPLDEDMPERVVSSSQELRDIHTSMYDDWKSGRTTEIEELNGYIVKRGQELGIPVPMNEMLVALVKAITEREADGKESIKLEGNIQQEFQLSRNALKKLPKEYQIESIEAFMPGMKGCGVKIKGILDVVTINVGVDHLTFVSQDEKYSASLTLAQAHDYGILLYEYEGKAFPEGRGGPFRLVTPGLGDLCANVKQVGRIIFSQGQREDTRPAEVCAED